MPYKNLKYNLFLSGQQHVKNASHVSAKVPCFTGSFQWLFFCLTIRFLWQIKILDTVVLMFWTSFDHFLPESYFLERSLISCKFFFFPVWLHTRFPEGQQTLHRPPTASRGRVLTYWMQSWRCFVASLCLCWSFLFPLSVSFDLKSNMLLRLWSYWARWLSTASLFKRLNDVVLWQTIPTISVPPASCSSAVPGYYWG